MAVILNNAVPFAMGGVVLVLLMGFINMFRGGSPNTSQRLMRWRVGLQFLTIVLVLVAIWARG
ncbi:twin transmembrane helix small protein [Alsobacter sp. SYSU BS001988]